MMTAWMRAPSPGVSHAALLALQVAVALPMVGVMFLDDRSVPGLLFVAAAVPASLMLAYARLLVLPRSVVLAGALLVVAGLLLSTIVHDAPGQRILVNLLWRGAMVLWFFYLVALAVRLDRDAALYLVLGLAVACAASAALNLYLFFTLPLEELPAEAHVRFAPIVGMASGLFSTTLSATYAVFAAAAFAIAVAYRRTAAVRLTAAAAALVIGFALALTQTRSAYLAIAAAIVTVAACLSPRIRWAVLAALALAVLVVLLYPPAFDVVMRRGASYRPGTWVQFLPSFLESPFLGIGQREPIRILVDGAEIHHPHNVLLSAQVRGGLLAFLGMLAMLVGGLAVAWRFARRFGDPMVLAMVVALAVAGLFDYEAKVTPADWTWLTIWLPLGLAAGCEMVLRRPPAPG